MLTYATTRKMGVLNQKEPATWDAHNDIETGVSFVVNAKRKTGLAEIWVL